MAGHHVLNIHGKGNVLRTVKAPVDVWLDVMAWRNALGDVCRVPVSGDDPVLVQISKVGEPIDSRPLSDRAIYAIVIRRLVDAGVKPLGPHVLRATFVTIALEAGRHSLSFRPRSDTQGPRPQ